MKITIHFDGGCNPNPGQMYGSYSIQCDDVEIFTITEDYGDGTNNVAEFIALYRALVKTVDLVQLMGKLPGHGDLEIFTDSTIVRNRIQSRNRGDRKTAGGKRMTEWTDKCLYHALRFKTLGIHWEPREANVERFGH